MNIKEIKQAIASLPPDELAHFRAWFKEYESNVKYDESIDSQMPMEDILTKAKGSLKGSGAMKALMEERRKG